jgi:transposase-like protein
MTCPFCEADRPELVSQFGSQLLFSQYRCRACGSYFEGLHDEYLALWQRSREARVREPSQPTTPSDKESHGNPIEL